MKREPDVYCERVLREDVAVAYLRGDLREDERDAFEQHFFECADCFERLQVVRELGGLLRREPVDGGRPQAGGWASRRTPAVGWLAWAAGAAFVAVGAAVVLRNVTPTGGVPATPLPAASSAAMPSAAPTPEGPSLEALARVEPPPYAPLVVRGAEPAEAAFDRAMEHYVRGDHAAAASFLRSAVEQDPASGEARFYLGVSELMAGQTGAAIRELGLVAGGEDEDFAEAARYYLAKAHLARREVAAARRELQRVARGDGAHKEQAQKLLQALGAEP